MQEDLNPWSTLGSVDPRQLVEARLQLHWAVQLVSAFANAELEHLPDDSQSNLGWQDDLDVLLGRRRPDGLAAGLSLPKLELFVFNNAGAVVDTFPLAGRTLNQARSWLGTLTPDRDSPPVKLSDYDMPDHGVAADRPFALEPEVAFSEIARWYANGDSALRALAASGPGWAEVRCWPHHFDLGTLVSLEASSDPASGRSIGVGMSPGDASYAEPYFYVNPYGLPSTPAAPPELPHPAHWHTEGWFGAVLTASALLETNDPATELERFLNRAVAANRGLLAG